VNGTGSDGLSQVNGTSSGGLSQLNATSSGQLEVVLLWQRKSEFCETTTKGSLKNHQATHSHAMATGLRRFDSGCLTLAWNQKPGHFIKGKALKYQKLVGFPYIPREGSALRKF